MTHLITHPNIKDYNEANINARKAMDLVLVARLETHRPEAVAAINAAEESAVSWIIFAEDATHDNRVLATQAWERLHSTLQCWIKARGGV